MPSRKLAERAPLTRDRVLSTAMELADRDGLDALTMRRLADELGVEAMSLYYHLPNKNAILDGVIELTFGEIEVEVGGFAPPVNVPWQPALRERILGARRVLLRHPWTPPVMESRGTLVPTMARHVDGVVGIMQAGGLSNDLIHHAMHALGSRMYGFVQEMQDDDTTVSGPDLAQMAAFVPHLAAMLADVVHDDPGSTLGWCDDQTEFEFALDLLLDGLERRRASEHRERP